jgi:NitT/TauT family transport system ATP-binding protein
MSDELLALWDLTRPAVVFVTHDLEEAIALADTVVVLTAGPAATIKARFRVDLPRPRVVQEIRFDQRFLDIYHQIWDALRTEVDIAYSQSTRLDTDRRAS